MTKRRIIFRADGNSQIGLGHVVRSLALAAMLRDEFECVFAIQAPSQAIEAQIRQVCAGIISLPATPATEDRYLHELDAYLSEEEIVVLDGYNFDSNYQLNVKAIGAMLVCIDDIHAYPFVADAVINQAGGVEAGNYQTAPYTKVYLGPDYALLRKPFLAAAKSARKYTEDQHRVLVNLGGADPQNHTLEVAKAVRALDPSIPIEIVIGAAYRHQVALQGWLQRQHHVAVHQNMGAEEMCRLMQACAMAVTSASGVAYEYATVGGLLFVMQTADNQHDLYQFLTTSGVAKAYDALPAVLISPSLEALFEEQVSRQRAQFDGNSEGRFKELFAGLSLGASLRLRQVTEGDLQLLYTWANDPQVRENSFNSSPISLQSHTQWFNGIRQDAQTLLYMVESDGIPAAHIRFNLSDQEAVISYLIAAEYRGKGLGHIVLQKGIAQLRKTRPAIKTVRGLIQKENIASIRAFEKVGFTPGAPDAKHPEAFMFELDIK